MDNREAFMVWGLATMLLGGLPGAILLLYGAYISDRDRMADERSATRQPAPQEREETDG